MGGGVVAQKNGTFGSLAKYRRIGDLTATSAVSGEPIKGATYMPRIKGGVLGDGFNSLIAAWFNTFPNTTSSQNNGVIQITGVGSRYIGYYIAAILAFLGLFPIVDGIIFQTLPQAVLFWVVLQLSCSAQL